MHEKCFRSPKVLSKFGNDALYSFMPPLATSRRRRQSVFGQSVSACICDHILKVSEHDIIYITNRL